MLFQLAGILVVWVLAPLVMSAVSLLYFYAGNNSQSFRLRILACMHGVAGTVVFLSAFAVAFFGNPGPALGQPYLVLWLLPAALVVMSLWHFSGPKRTHLLLLPLLAAMSWAVVVGYTIVGGGK